MCALPYFRMVVTGPPIITRNLEECNIFLLYYGNLEFEDTRSANSNSDLEAATPGLEVPTPASACYDLRPKKQAD